MKFWDNAAVKTKKDIRSVSSKIIAFFCFVLLSAGLKGHLIAGKQNSLQNSQSSARTALLESSSHKGSVITTMNSGGYTYIEFDENGRKLWAAAPLFTVAVGDTIEFQSALPMSDFQSRTLDKTFEAIFFVNYIRVNNEPPLSGMGVALPKGHRPIGDSGRMVITVDEGSIIKAEDGYSIEECYELRDLLNGQSIRVRGRVVKFTSGIMGRNWIHIKDGTGIEGSDDLTVTSDVMVAPGDVILVSGILAAEKDFGAGYSYVVIIENAAISIEKNKPVGTCS